jgi:signal transduction histidine kinase
VTLSPEVVQLITYAIAASGMGFTWITLMIVGIQLRQPVAGRLAVVWGLAASRNLILYSASLLALEPPAWIPAPAVAIAALQVASGAIELACIPIYADIAALVAQRPARAHAYRRWIAFGVIGAVCFTAFALAAQWWPSLGLPDVRDLSRMRASLVSIVGVVTLTRESRRSPAQRPVLLLIVAGFIILAARPIHGLLFARYALTVGPSSATGTAAYLLSIVVAFMVAGATQYAAIFRYQYDQSIRDGNDLHDIESVAARVRREQMLASFAVGFGHDVNNIIQTVVLCAEQVRHRAEHDPKIQHVASILDEAARRGRDISGRLTALEKRDTTIHDRIDAAAILRALETPLRKLAPLHVVEVSPDETAPLIQCHRMDIERAIVNLVVNARDASKVDSLIGVRMCLRRQAVPPGTKHSLRDWVCIAVEDRGAGVAPERLGMIFDAYYTTKGAGGTGLGLPSVRAIMRSAQGEVTVDSKVGAGTVMTLWFPVMVPNAAGG